MSTKSKIDNGVSVIVPTFRRPDGLKIALESLMTQSANGLTIEIIVADNDPKGSAKTFVTKFAKTAAIKTRYLHVPDPGVSNARNGALATAKGRYLAFLDDDQEAGENWLSTLLEISQKYQAALAFIPTLARIPGQSKYDDYLQDFFSRQGPKLEEGMIKEFFGCGNSLLDTKLCTLPNPPFDVEMNETGGEDDMLFSELQTQGIKIAWSRNAICYEDIRPHRATPEYIKVRSFAFGQGPVQMCYETSPTNWLGVIKWMVVGVVQWGIYTPLAWVTKLFGHPSYIHYLSRAAQGKGKIFWYGDNRPKLYGAAVVENKAF
ncbi:MAG: glycosyltransferase family 2 protein [Hyphomonadaceae bacterium]|nr:glycosyltransferase family 2 protein [Hyphomonadaceae bacterium]